MCLPETWHQPEVLSSLNEAGPPGYGDLQGASCTGQGGHLPQREACQIIWPGGTQAGLQTSPEGLRCDP